MGLFNKHLLPTGPMIDIGTGFPIVLLPDHRNNIGDWISVVEELSSAYRVLIPRLPFHTSPLSVERRTDITTYLKHFLNDNLINPVTLIGSGTGAESVLCFASKFPGKVSSIVATKPFCSSEKDLAISETQIKRLYFEQYTGLHPSMVILRGQSFISTNVIEYKYAPRPSNRVDRPSDLLGPIQEFLRMNRHLDRFTQRLSHEEF